MSSAAGRTTPIRSDGGAIVAGLGALLLLVSLFVHWYQPGRSAWTVFETWDLVLAGLAVSVVVAAAGRLGIIRRGADRWLVLPSVGSLVIVAASLINHPPAAIGHRPMFGIWLALAASALMVIGSAMSIARVSVAIELERRPAVSQPQGGTTEGEAAPEPTEQTRVIQDDSSAG